MIMWPVVVSLGNIYVLLSKSILKGEIDYRLNVLVSLGLLSARAVANAVASIHKVWGLWVLFSEVGKSGFNSTPIVAVLTNMGI